MIRPVTTVSAADRWDQLLQALAAEPRRQVVVSLLEAAEGDWLSLPEAAAPPGASDHQRPSDVELIHHHLPALADRRYVEWRRQPFSVRRGPNFEEIGTVLESLFRTAEAYPPELVENYPPVQQYRCDD